MHRQNRVPMAVSSSRSCGEDGTGTASGRSIPVRPGGTAAALSGEAGLSLIEVIVAMAILLIGIVAVLQTFSISLATTREGGSYTTASVLASEVAEQIEAQPAISTGQSSGTFDDAPDYEWQSDIEPADSNGLMRTTVTVTWQTGGKTRQFDLVFSVQPPEAAQSTEVPPSQAAPSGGN